MRLVHSCSLFALVVFVALAQHGSAAAVPPRVRTCRAPAGLVGDQTVCQNACGNLGLSECTPAGWTVCDAPACTAPAPTPVFACPAQSTERCARYDGSLGVRRCGPLGFGACESAN